MLSYGGVCDEDSGAVSAEVSGTEGMSSLETDGEAEAGEAERGLYGWLHIDCENLDWAWS